MEVKAHVLLLTAIRRQISHKRAHVGYCVWGERGGLSRYCVWGDRGGISVYCEWWVTGVEIHVIVCSEAEVEIQGIVFRETGVCFTIMCVGREGWNFRLLYVG